MQPRLPQPRRWLAVRNGTILSRGLAVAVVLAIGSARADAQVRPANPNQTASLPATSAGATSPDAATVPTDPGDIVERWTGPRGLSSALQIMLLMTAVSVAPAILLMTTSFVRIVVVLGLLRQALGTQQLPPSQVITALSLFCTVLIMTPVWKQVYDQGIAPYSAGQTGMHEAWERGHQPLRRFMSDQIEQSGNEDDVHLFLDYLDPPTEAATRPQYVFYGARASEGERDVPMQALLPAYMLSELKTAFVIGFQIYLPFLILDLVISSVLISMGMLMLPPVLVSLPFKLLLFVLVDGWHLVVQMLLSSFAVSG